MKFYALFAFFQLFLMGNLFAQVMGIYSGTFDPVHRGHIAAMESAIKNGELNKIIVYPNLDPPHKSPILNFDKRWKLLELAVRNDERIILPSKPVLKRVLSQNSPNEALFDWVQKEFNSPKTYRVLGADSFEKFFNFEKSVSKFKNTKNYNLMMVERDGYKVRVPKEFISKVKVVAEGNGFGYSSSMYRSDPLRHEQILPKEVAFEIQKNGYYGRSRIIGHYGSRTTPKQLQRCFDLFKMVPHL